MARIELYDNMDQREYLMACTIEPKLLCNGAFLLYAYYFTLPYGSVRTNQDLHKDLGLCPKTISKYKKQLVDLDLIYPYTCKIRGKIIVIGSVKYAASRIKKYWDKRDSDPGKPIRLEDILSLREMSDDIFERDMKAMEY